MPSQSTFNSTEPYANLLAAAQSAHEQAHYMEAVILAQTAVELFMEHILGQLYVKRDIEYLKPPFEHLLINYNIGNSKVSGLYIALSGDKVKQAPFWPRFIDHTELRNALVHEGVTATQAQSLASIESVAALIAHVKAANAVN